MGDKTISSPNQNGQASSYPHLLRHPDDAYEEHCPIIMQPIPPGWAISHPPAGTLLFDPDMVPWLMDQFGAFMEDLSLLDKLHVRDGLSEWQDSVAELSYMDQAPTKLRALVVEVSRDLLSRHPAVQTVVAKTRSRWKDEFQLPDGTPVVELKDLNWWGDEVTWFGNSKVHCKKLKMQTNKTSPATGLFTSIMPFRSEWAERYFPSLVEKCKAITRFAMGNAASRVDVMQLVALTATYSFEQRIDWALLISHKRALLLRFTRSEEEGLSIGCSDIISDRSILPSILVSLQLALLGEMLDERLYPQPPWISIPKITTAEPTLPSIGVPWDVRDRTLKDLDASELILTICSQGATSARECYTLRRAEDGKDGSTKTSEDEQTNKEEKRPVLLAYSIIGEGTCGTVFMAQYGHHRIAAKASPSSVGEHGSMVDEYEIYMRLRKAGLEGKVAPRCLGLYNCDEMTLLLTVYSGSALANFSGLTYADRLSIYRAAKALEDAGINQGSFSPRNVVCDDNQIFRIIDFHRATYDPHTKGDRETMHQYYFDLEGEQPGLSDKLVLDWSNVVPLPETDDSDLEQAGAEAVK